MEVIYRCNKCDDFESSDINIAVVHRCASKLEVPPANGEQQANHENCHCFIDGAQCVNQETTMRCYGKPCVLNRGKRS